MIDNLGDRQKLYEGMESDRRLMPRLPALARLDGRAFHTFTRGLERPFDCSMSTAMQMTTRWLVHETNANVGYTQSDEITLAWYTDDPKSQIFFDGRIMKMTSQLAALCSVYFNEVVRSTSLEQKAKQRPTFDCRVWNTPTLDEAANVFVWREWDATKNSISMAAQHYFSANELHNKHTGDMQEMLFNKHGVNWNNYPDFFKRGSYYQRKKVAIPFTTEELERLPPKHAARTNPELLVERHVVQHLALPPITKVTNREAVLFFGADPITEGE